MFTGYFYSFGHRFGHHSDNAYTVVVVTAWWNIHTIFSLKVANSHCEMNSLKLLIPVFALVQLHINLKQNEGIACLLGFLLVGKTTEKRNILVLNFWSWNSRMLNQCEMMPLSNSFSPPSVSRPGLCTGHVIFNLIFRKSRI